ncbi:pathogenesis-related leaf protein 4-like [Rhododendron vialii]|uniref:pathogenesis-related leaf protein 4-like n=1 Tax=Rhododendron vialii TaxID=182163 RepID=UPI00265EAB05|nr:pathogenesis-related leaf protein 4-like [Rhododendron vialii]
MTISHILHSQNLKMGSSSDITSLALVSLTLLAMLHSSHGQNSQQDYLNGHNSARSAVGVGPMTWDANVAAFAQQYASQRAGDCALKHSGGGGKYGENIAVGSGDFTGAAAVGLWVSEKADYNHNSNTCAAGRVCGHYTQVVWRKSVRLGCARVRCNSGSWFITCNYDPPGNYVGESPY